MNEDKKDCVSILQQFLTPIKEEIKIQINLYGFNKYFILVCTSECSSAKEENLAMTIKTIIW